MPSDVQTHSRSSSTPAAPPNLPLVETSTADFELQRSTDTQNTIRRRLLAPNASAAFSLALAGGIIRKGEHHPPGHTTKSKCDSKSPKTNTATTIPIRTTCGDEQKATSSPPPLSLQVRRANDGNGKLANNTDRWIRVRTTPGL